MGWFMCHTLWLQRILREGRKRQRRARGEGTQRGQGAGDKEAIRQLISFTGRNLSSRGRKCHPAVPVGIGGERQAPVHLRGPADTEQSPRGRRASPESPTGTSPKGGRGTSGSGCSWAHPSLLSVHLQLLREMVRLGVGGETKKINV